ncbi:MAG: hypothetical protein ACK48K_04505, partial [Planctomycetota bacterium]
MAKSKPNKNSETAKKREAGSRLVVTGKPTVRREGETVIVSVPIKVYRLNGRQMILAADMVFVAKRDMARPVIYGTP